MTKIFNKTVILTADKFEDMELFVPMFRLLELGWTVDIAAPKLIPIRGEHGYTCIHKGNNKKGCPNDP